MAASSLPPPRSRVRLWWFLRLRLRSRWRSVTGGRASPMPISTTVFPAGIHFCREGSLGMHATRERIATKDGVPHISLVFREMWDTTALNGRWFRMRRVETGLRGIPHLAKNQRDVGHPSLVAGPESAQRWPPPPEPALGPPPDIAGALCMLLGRQRTGPLTRCSCS